jgi:hypothetical protein
MKPMKPKKSPRLELDEISQVLAKSSKLTYVIVTDIEILVTPHIVASPNSNTI